MQATVISIQVRYCHRCGETENSFQHGNIGANIRENQTFQERHAGCKSAEVNTAKLTQRVLREFKAKVMDIRDAME